MAFAVLLVDIFYIMDFIGAKGDREIIYTLVSFPSVLLRRLLGARKASTIQPIKNLPPTNRLRGPQPDLQWAPENRLVERKPAEVVVVVC